MAEGLSTFEAAVQLNLSEYTVRDYVSAIMQKMNVKNRTEAVAKAIREGLI
ncbi:response regulator transcription factor [Caldibacillus debilis]|uniref:Response regulator containing a CheY-like receiver domain and an HTH DNA-binding domain n=1 Tax=Caldibacillus debilis GB1 TaxID=1339248 RepID=A0A420VF65_9BACI|nr:LuxR C-terminal-related transcriptional regulator [Caldibacillus debilis]RKO62259.1 Response regulator containing a CheY-like receiver domain and an HTH DNA-binding domain [Caldibacillus debilis GB1]